MIARVFSVLGSRVAASAMQGLMLLVLTQLLGPVGFGHFAAVLVISGLLSALLSFGTDSLALRVRAHENPKKVAGVIAWLRYPSTLLSALFSFVVAQSIVGVNDFWLIGAAVAVGASEASGRIVESILFGQARVKRAQFGMILRRALVLGAVVAGAMEGSVLIWVTFCAAAIVVTSPLWLIGVVERPRSIVPVLREALPYWGAELLSRLQTADVLIATFVLSPAGTGIYAAASRITSPLNVMATSMKSIFSPAMAASEGHERKGIFRRSMRFLSVVCGGLVVASPVIGWLVELILGAEYAGAAWPVAVLCIGTGVAALSQGYVSYLYAVGNARPVFLNRLWVVPLSLVISIPLGFVYGPVGLSFSIVVSQLAQAVSLHFVVRRSF